MVKIGVFSDTHIGRTVPNVVAEYRRRAFRHAFKQAIDIFVDKKVEYVIHGGDVFERRSMTPGDTRFVKEELQRLVDRLDGKVRILVVRGNHDGTSENSVLDYIEHPLADYLKVIGDGTLRGEVDVYDDGKVAVVGFGYHPYAAKRIEKVEKEIRRCFEESSAENKVFVIHAFIEGHQDIPPGVPKYQVIPRSIIKELGADLVIAGHHHVHAKPKVSDGVTVLTPGATESVDLSDDSVHGATILNLGEKRLKYEFKELTPLYRIRNTVVDSSGTIRKPEWYVERAIVSMREFGEELKTRGAEGIARVALKGSVDGDKFDLQEKLEKDLRKLMEEHQLLLQVVLENDLIEAGSSISITETTTKSELLSQVFRSLGDEGMEAAISLVEEVEFTLEEKASTRTGLLRDSDRQRFVKKWLEILEGRT
ncbi:metallophosphoesterase family protein [Candidatus Bathyarchaeota archaeon]|nr:metallophosphoesterase family protein [Candidatus Bathyarchaeota archaeon]